MNYSKQENISETSRDENDQASSQRIKDNNKTGIGRFYECTFCKRGFTNAQALGGHMNIHRKDKATAKPKGGTNQSSNSKSATSSSNRSSDFEVSNPSMYLVPVTNDHAHYHATMEGRLVNYQFYLPMSVPNCPPQYAYYLSDSNEHVASLQDLKLQEELLEANLSLEIGSSRLADSKEKSTNEADDMIEHEVDLELRLGHDP